MAKAKKRAKKAAKPKATKDGLVTGEPVAGFPIEFEWHSGPLFDLFEEQVKLLKSEIARAHAEDRVVVYLSCPISARGGGFHVTNVEIAKHTQRRLLNDWGHRFWILNPAMYQMESKEGRGLIQMHAERLGISAAQLSALPKPSGGDYMRMWTRVLVEDAEPPVPGNHLHLGRYFDMFYFLGPSDVRDFFSRGGAVEVTAGVEEYFARQFAMDPDFRDYYSVPNIDWKPDWQRDPQSTIESTSKQRDLRNSWELLRKLFFRFYSVKASVQFSLGSHDEWNILCKINQLRLKNKNASGELGDVGSQLSGYFDGRQVDPSAVAAEVQPGYAIQ